MDFQNRSGYGGNDCLGASAGMMSKLFETLDIDSNGELTREEWMNAFNRLDVKRQGVISRKEWTLLGGENFVFDQIAGKSQFAVANRQNWRDAYSRLDKNRDGRITLDEWFSFAPKVRANNSDINGGTNGSSPYGDSAPSKPGKQYGQPTETSMNLDEVVQLRNQRDKAFSDLKKRDREIEELKREVADVKQTLKQEMHYSNQLQQEVQRLRVDSGRIEQLEKAARLGTEARNQKYELTRRLQRAEDLVKQLRAKYEGESYDIAYPTERSDRNGIPPLGHVSSVSDSKKSSLTSGQLLQVPGMSMSPRGQGVLQRVDEDDSETDF